MLKSTSITIYTAQVKRLDERLRKAEADAQLYNAREGLLGLPITDYSHVRSLIEIFDPFLQFWTTSAAWRVSEGMGLGRRSVGVGADLWYGLMCSACCCPCGGDKLDHKRVFLTSIHASFYLKSLAYIVMNYPLTLKNTHRPTTSPG